MAVEDGSNGALRIDKWLWYARFFKTRALASRVVAAGKVRLGGAVTPKAHQKVRPGDVLTFPQGPNIRVVKIVELGVRRGPAPEAQALYEDLAPLPEPGARKGASGGVDAAELEPGKAGAPRRETGAGRPTKRDRRKIDRLMEDRLMEDRHTDDPHTDDPAES
jgi:ribosome-associated heat shock protein Hsp15